MDVRRLDEMQAQGRSIFDTELAVMAATTTPDVGYARVSDRQRRADQQSRQPETLF